MNEPESQNILPSLFSLEPGEFWGMTFYFLVALVLTGRRLWRAPLVRLDLYLLVCAAMLLLCCLSAWAASLFSISISHGVDGDYALRSRTAGLERLILVFIFSVFGLAALAFVPPKKE